jgi:hypothetical protein
VDGNRDRRTLRASDADREHIAEVLRSAAADGRLTLSELADRIETLYAAKTYGELEPVIDDLPGEVVLPTPATPAVPSATDPGPATTARVGGVAGARETKVVFGGIARKGPWVVPSRYRVKAVFGGADLDLREATLETADVTIEARAVFGGVNIVVPPDIRVLVDGDGIFGGFADDSGAQPGPGAPILRVTGKAVFGGVSVQRKSGGQA